MIALISPRNIEPPSLTSYYFLRAPVVLVSKDILHVLDTFLRIYILVYASGWNDYYRETNTVSISLKLPQSRERDLELFSHDVLLTAEPGDKQAIDRGDERLFVSGVRRSIPQCSCRNVSFVARRFMGQSCASERVNFQKQASVFRPIRHDGSRRSDGGGREARSLIAVQSRGAD